MIKEIKTDRELLLLRNKEGYILNVAWNRVIKLHLTSCRVCNPNRVFRIKVESKIENNKGEPWYSDKKGDVEAKAIEMVRNRGYRYTSCEICNPYL